jgi:hypothetical protein
MKGIVGYCVEKLSMYPPLLIRKCSMPIGESLRVTLWPSLSKRRTSDRRMAAVQPLEIVCSELLVSCFRFRMEYAMTKTVRAKAKMARLPPRLGGQPGVDYSFLKAMSGSTFAARKAGMEQANRTTVDRPSPTVTKTLGS